MAGNYHKAVVTKLWSQLLKVTPRASSFPQQWVAVFRDATQSRGGPCLSVTDSVSYWIIETVSACPWIKHGRELIINSGKMLSSGLLRPLLESRMDLPSFLPSSFLLWRKGLELINHVLLMRTADDLCRRDRRREGNVRMSGSHQSLNEKQFAIQSKRSVRLSTPRCQSSSSSRAENTGNGTGDKKTKTSPAIFRWWFEYDSSRLKTLQLLNQLFCLLPRQDELQSSRSLTHPLTRPSIHPSQRCFAH